MDYISSQLTAIIESIPTAITIVNEQGIIVFVNTQAGRLFGYSSDQLLGQPLERLIPPRYRAAHPDHRHNFFKDPKMRPMGIGRELFGLHQDGSEFPVEIGLNPLRTEKGTYVVSAILDITERKRLEALERSNSELQQFASIASHDLQAPLRAIGGFAGLLHKRYQGQLDEKADHYLIRIMKAVERMQALITDLLSIAHVEAQMRPLSSFDACVALYDAIEWLEVSIKESQATVTHDKLPTLVGDQTQLSLLLQNLIGNSLKYRGTSAPEVHVSAEQKNGAWTFAVRDNGLGIDPKFHDKIFDMFYRLQNHADYPGTGLGLAICRRIAERHGGKIWLESTPGEGSTFYFTIPEHSPN